MNGNLWEVLVLSTCYNFHFIVKKLWSFPFFSTLWYFVIHFDSSSHDCDNIFQQIFNVQSTVSSNFDEWCVLCQILMIYQKYVNALLRLRLYKSFNDDICVYNGNPGKIQKHSDEDIKKCNYILIHFINFSIYII